MYNGIEVMRMNRANTKLVNIFGEPPNVKLQILDNNGKLKTYRITEMLLGNQETEVGYDKREYKVVYYKGRVEVIDRFLSQNKTVWLKYIPSKKKWFICGNYSDLPNDYTSSYRSRRYS